MFSDFLGDSASSFAYAYGRLSGMEPKLASQSLFDSLAAASTVNEAVSLLGSTSYGLGLQGADPTSDAGLEDALSKGFLSVFQDVLSMLKEKDARDLNVLFMSGWDVQNIKHMVRTLHAGMSLSASELQTSPLGALDPGVIRNLLESKSLEDLRSRIPEEYGEMLRFAFEDYARTKSLFEFENQADKALVYHWLKSVGASLRDYVKTRVDAINIVCSLRCRHGKISPGKYLIPDGFYLNSKKIAALADESISLKIALEDTPYLEMVSENEEKNGAYLTTMESRLSNFLSQEVSRQAMKSPLSIYSIIHFIELKVREYRTIRALLLGKRAGLAAEDLKRMVTWIQST